MIFDKKQSFSRVEPPSPKKSESRPRRPKNPVTTSTPKKSSHDLDSQKSKSARDAHFSQNLFRLNLDASRVPEALVNSFRLLTQLRTRLNPPEGQTPLKPLIFKKNLLTRLFFPNSFNFTLETFPKWKSRSLIPKIALPSRNSGLFIVTRLFFANSFNSDLFRGASRGR